MSLVTGVIASPVLLAKTPKSDAVADISKAIEQSKSIPTGYKGAEGKIKAEKGTIKTIADIEGTDAGFLIEFEPVEVKNAKYLSLDIKGKILQRQGWDHYASIQIKDEDGKRYIVLELCKEGKYGNCEGKPITKSSSLRKGTNLKIKLPAELETIQRIEVVFVGATKVSAGFSLSNIKLVK
jgi:hypothetical protein